MVVIQVAERSGLFALAALELQVYLLALLAP